MKTTQECSVEDCERPVLAREMCSMHYHRWQKYGTTDLPARPSPAERLAAGLIRMPSECLEWTRYVDPNGYGRLGRILIHRLAWELANGPIPDGLHVLHHCDNPPCAQTEPTDGYPEGHLFLGTPADNSADMAAKRRGYWQQKTHCPQGHEYTPANTYVLPARPGTRYCRTCHNIRNYLRYHLNRNVRL